MGSKGEKKSGLVGEKSHTVYSANWKLDALLEKELHMLDTSKHRVEHRISMDQVVAKKRFQVKLHRSKVFHARMKGDKEMLKKLITKDNYDFHTNTTSVDVLNKRREKDLAKKRILHRQSQEKMMVYRSATPAAAQVDTNQHTPLADNDGEVLEATSAVGTFQTPVIRPMTAIERISKAKIMAGKATKVRPATAAVDKTRLLKSSVTVTLPPATSTTATKMGVIPESQLSKEKVTGEKESEDVSARNESKDIVIKVTSAEEDINESILHEDSSNTKQSEDPKLSANISGPAETTQLYDEPGRTGDTMDIVNSQTDERQGVVISETINLPKKSSLRPSTAVNSKSKSSKLSRPKTAHANSDSKQPLLTTPDDPKTSVIITDPASDQSDNESTASAYRRPSFSRSRGEGRKSSSKSNRKKDAMSIFSDQKKVTIMDIDQDRRERSKHRERIEEYVKTVADVKTDPDLIVDYYMARLLEDSNISEIQKNVESIRDMPDSDYDKDLSKRSMGDLEANTITFRDVNRSYEEYEHDPYAPLPPSSLKLSLLSRNSTVGVIKRQESRISMPTTAWQGDDSDSDSD